MSITHLNAPLKVSTDGTAGPYIIVTPEQLGQVVVALREAEIVFRVDEDALLTGGTPALVVIDLGSAADVNRIQRVLDGVSNDLGGNAIGRRNSSTREELVVRGPLGAMRLLLERLDVDHVGDWNREREIEVRFGKSLPPRTRGFCFSKRVPAVRRQIAVLLQSRSPVAPEEVFVSGIVPLEGRDVFSLEDRDEVMRDVRGTLIEPLGRDLPVRILSCRVTVGPDLEDNLSEESIARLRDFSEGADKTVLQGRDILRWQAFIKQTHVDDAVVDSGMLAMWLSAQGFQNKLRDFLVQNYESGRRLLQSYDEERQ